MTEHVEETCAIAVYVAGDIITAKAWLRQYCYDTGFCVTVTPTSFIYTGGEEEGLRVGVVNYPRFPSKPEELEAKAQAIGAGLLKALCQRTALVVGPQNTTWLKGPK